MDKEYCNEDAVKQIRSLGDYIRKLETQIYQLKSELDISQTTRHATQTHLINHLSKLTGHKYCSYPSFDWPRHLLQEINTLVEKLETEKAGNSHWVLDSILGKAPQSYKDTRGLCF